MKTKLEKKQLDDWSQRINIVLDATEGALKHDLRKLLMDVSYELYVASGEGK